VFDVDAML